MRDENIAYMANEIMQEEDKRILVEIGAEGSSKQRNLNTLISLLKHRLQSVSKAKSIDENGNVVMIDVDIFSNEVLESFIHLAISGFNQMPTFTSFTLEDNGFIDTFAELLVEGAAIYALSSQALVERGREFQLKEEGINFQPPNLAELLNTQFAMLLKLHHEKLEMIKRQFRITNGTGKLVKGERQRYRAHKAHGKFPKDTECWASRIDDETVMFEYDDGTKIKLEGAWFLIGLEWPIRRDSTRGSFERNEKVISDSSILPSFLMLMGAVAGGLLAAATKAPAATRVAEVEEPIMEEVVDDRQDCAQA